LRGKGTLATTGADVVHQAVCGVEQRLHLVIGQRTPPRITLVLPDVRDRVPLME